MNHWSKLSTQQPQPSYPSHPSYPSQPSHLSPYAPSYPQPQGYYNPSQQPMMMPQQPMMMMPQQPMMMMGQPQMMMMPVMMMPQQPMMMQPQPFPYPPQQQLQPALLEKTIVVQKKEEPKPQLKPQLTVIRDSSFTYFSEYTGEVADEQVLTNSSSDSIPKIKILVIGSNKSGKTSVINWMLFREYCTASSDSVPGLNMMKNNILVDRSGSSSTSLVVAGSRSNGNANGNQLQKTQTPAPQAKVATEFRKTVAEPGIGQVDHYYVEVNGDFVRNRDAVAKLATKSFDAILIVIDHTRLEEEVETLKVVIQHLRPILVETQKKLMVVKTKCDDASMLTRSSDTLSRVERELRELVRENQFYYFEYLSLLSSQSTSKIGPSFGNRLFKFFLPLLACKTRE